MTFLQLVATQNATPEDNTHEGNTTETKDIPNDIDLKIKRIDIRKHFPHIMNGYAHYTLHICPQCGKVELYLVKPVKESLEELIKKIKLEPLKY